MNALILILVAGAVAMGACLAFAGKRATDKESSMSANYKIVEIRDFACPGMTGFTFQYPVFEGWEIRGTRTLTNNECVIDLDFPVDFQIDLSKKRNALVEPAPQIIVKKISSQPLARKFDHNPQGIPYLPVENARRQSTGVEFYMNGSGISIELLAINESFGFLQDTFWQTVIESFRVTE